jgi:sugar/nucleoside kinase (ribokinase family)
MKNMKLDVVFIILYQSSISRKVLALGGQKSKMKERVFCIGHISADIFIERSALQSLRVGGCIQSQDLTIYAGGDVANVSYWLGSLDVPVSFFGIIASDALGHFLSAELKKMNVNCQFKITKKYPTASILIIVEPDGERSFIINGKSQDDLEWDELPITDILGQKLIYTSAYTIENDPIKSVIKKMFKQVKSVELNPPKTMFNLAAFTTVEKHGKEIKSDILPYTDILVGNSAEFMLLTKHSSQAAGILPLSVAKEMQGQFPNLEIILITDGENGCYFSNKEREGHIKAPKVNVIDTTGAGDGFSAGFIAGYLNGDDITSSVRRGINLGCNICQGYGARYSSSL